MTSQFKTPIIIAIFVMLFLCLSVVASADDKKVGEWTQYTWMEGRWKELGVFLVYRQGGNYLMAPARQRVGSDVVNSRGLFGVSFSNDQWQFKSDWWNGNIGTFLLDKVGPGMYYGWAYFGERKLDQNLWLLTK